MAGNPQDYYNCICQWLQAHEGAMHQLINQLRGSNSALCTQTECFESVRAGFGAREDAAPTEPGLPLVQIMILVGLLMAVMTAMRPERAERRSSPNALLEKPAPGLGEPFPPPPPAL